MPGRFLLAHARTAHTFSKMQMNKISHKRSYSEPLAEAATPAPAPVGLGVDVDVQFPHTICVTTGPKVLRSVINPSWTSPNTKFVDVDEHEHDSSEFDLELEANYSERSSSSQSSTSTASPDALSTPTMPDHHTYQHLSQFDLDLDQQYQYHYQYQYDLSSSPTTGMGLANSFSSIGSSFSESNDPTSNSYNGNIVQWLPPLSTSPKSLPITHTTTMTDYFSSSVQAAESASPLSPTHVIPSAPKQEYVPHFQSHPHWQIQLSPIPESP